MIHDLEQSGQVVPGEQTGGLRLPDEGADRKRRPTYEQRPWIVHSCGVYEVRSGCILTRT
jgi:hypothetical protein